ncbi:peptidoglycan-associated lipoprotein Pal [Reinekea thalattae]|uniref:Peptidoglycan-associated lipoprotein n=1 Tax=Reinekea thalattae TaxID=2593301 RepID=A0A5C8ZB39_9GAMM|nr:peptidoglycan-associated lipoprotein Pal [Reinekea thalattae]TXR54020.1 peptidoglycan-associated lipoprotein Pal [Reinekea thalattae]
MAKSKLLTAAVLSSALILVACGGNTQSEDTTATTETTATEAEATAEAAAEEMVEDAHAKYLEMTLVFFDYDQYEIKEEYRDMLDAHAAHIAATGATVVLEGHADERGTREYNLALGERRAKQVAAYLQVQGVSASQIDVVSYGEEKPLSAGNTEEAYSQNRRVEFVY